MRKAMIVMAILLVTSTAAAAGAQDDAILEVKGRGAEGKPAYRGGGVVTRGIYPKDFHRSARDTSLWQA